MPHSNLFFARETELSPAFKSEHTVPMPGSSSIILRIKTNCYVRRVYVPRFFVSSQQRCGVTAIKALRASLGSWTNCVTALRQISATALFYLEDSRRVRERERESERERERSVRTREREFMRKRFGSSFYMFFLHLGLPYANWA